MVRLLIAAFGIFGLASTASAQATCADEYVCYAQTSGSGCAYEVLIASLTDRTKSNTIGCFKTFAKAVQSASALAFDGKCTFIDSEE